MVARALFPWKERITAMLSRNLMLGACWLGLAASAAAFLVLLATPAESSCGQGCAISYKCQNATPIPCDGSCSVGYSGQYIIFSGARSNVPAPNPTRQLTAPTIINPCWTSWPCMTKSTSNYICPGVTSYCVILPFAHCSTPAYGVPTSFPISSCNSTNCDDL